MVIYAERQRCYVIEPLSQKIALDTVNIYRSFFSVLCVDKNYAFV
jgi:hypothetical protein